MGFYLFTVKAFQNGYQPAHYSTHGIVAAYSLKEAFDSIGFTYSQDAWECTGATVEIVYLGGDDSILVIDNPGVEEKLKEFLDSKEL